MNLDFSTGRKPLTVFSLAGLTDIVLLLLIFFLLTSSFVTQQGIRVNLPESAAGVPEEQQYVSVAITAEGLFFVGDQEVLEDDLATALAEARGDRDALVLRADAEATVRQFAAVASAAQANALRVLMATAPLEQ
ncbi:MAG: biopolymer transporter ExbD [Bacteroidota bacterium]